MNSVSVQSLTHCDDVRCIILRDGVCDYRVRSPNHRCQCQTCHSTDSMVWCRCYLVPTSCRLPFAFRKPLFGFMAFVNRRAFKMIDDACFIVCRCIVECTEEKTVLSLCILKRVKALE